jgi:2-oxoglutarate dehydrogenase E2 component (dihydrolipoamide succinyltransferase)
MSVEIKVPELGESISEVEIGDWLKGAGEQVSKDEPIATLESDKATVELPAPESGTIAKVLKQKGQTAKVGEAIAVLEQNGHARAAEKSDAATVQPAPKSSAKETPKAFSPEAVSGEPKAVTSTAALMPAVERLLAEHHLRPEEVKGTGPGGRLLKEDVLRIVRGREAKKTPEPSPSETKSRKAEVPVSDGLDATEEVVPMSRLRRTVAERLVEAQNSAALLTTFNEIDMSGVMALRKEHGESFQQKYNVKLGFMSFFVKACIDALKQYPAVNAEIRGSNIVYHHHYDIGVAVGSGKGLVVPVLRNAERMSFAEVEMAIGDLGRRARENKLKVEELQGGTFTISNGGIYGSLLSTPIVNPPQSGILGMHAIQERPVAHQGQIVIRPMMYVALTYDHRIIDGREAVSFLKRIKDAIENPARMLIEV